MIMPLQSAERGELCHEPEQGSTPISAGRQVVKSRIILADLGRRLA
jgi:hypothetical protein